VDLLSGALIRVHDGVRKASYHHIILAAAAYWEGISEISVFSAGHSAQIGET